MSEQNRLALALLFSKEYDVLVLDEPTNDLDIATINILEDYLQSFEGAIIYSTLLNVKYCYLFFLC